MLLASGCRHSPSREAERASPVQPGLVGRWEYAGRAFRGSGTGSIEAIGGQNIHSAHPDLIEFRDDGTFASHWSDEEFAKLDWPEEANPIEGVYSVKSSLFGDWLSMRPGFDRRFKLSQDTLVLRNLGDSWASEKYRRKD
jgi:hypothetical protein